MATFQVPQFIDQKPKIVGPLTLTQFFYIAGAAAVSFASFYIFNFFLWFLVSIIVLMLGLGFAFGKVNGQRMPDVVRAALNYTLRPRIYTWQRAAQNISVSTDKLEEISAVRKHVGFQQQLKSIILNVTTSRSRSPKDIRKEAGSSEDYETATFVTGEKRQVRRVDFSE